MPTPKSSKLPEFLVDVILPSREISLLYGPSGAGKSSWGFQFLNDLTKGLPILGHASHAVPCCYMALDRSTNSIERTLVRLGLIHGVQFPYVGVEQLAPKPNLLDVLSTARKFGAHLVFVEAIMRVLRVAGNKQGKSNDYNEVGDMMAEATKLCKDNDITILGSTHVPKSRGDNGTGIQDPRQKPLGSVALAGFCETQISIDMVDQGDPKDSRRRIVVLSRNAPVEVFEYWFDSNGHFVEMADEAADRLLDRVLEIEPEAQQIFTRSDAIKWGAKLGISEATVDRWLQKRLDKRIQRVERGKYTRILLQ